MSDEALKKLARAAGLQVRWTDAAGRPQQVKPDTLRAVLASLGCAADNPKVISESSVELDRVSRLLPGLITALAGEAVCIGVARRARLRPAGRDWNDAELSPAITGGMSFRAPHEIGYYDLEIDGNPHGLAVAPSRCYGLADVGNRERLSGLAVQIYALRGGTSEGFGDFAALRECATQAARFGMDAILINPTHAGRSSDFSRFSPYGPSTKFFLDPVYCDLSLVRGQTAQDACGGHLIAWPSAKAGKLRQLRNAYEQFVRMDTLDFRSFCEKAGPRLRDHAIFEALDSYFQAKGFGSWQQWPVEFRDARSSAVKEFAEHREKEVAFHLFAQWLAGRSADSAQAAAREKMAIGIISDMAVGIDANGSQAWSEPDELLNSLRIGAPPDAFNSQGQDWGLTTFSPASLRTSRFEGFIETIRAAMRHAGGVRIDHAMGLRRLWVLPKDATAQEGVYLTYPMQDLVRLIALESHRHRAIVIGEDLGTVPEGFRTQMAAAGMLGMRVLWFERMPGGRFLPPEQWDAHALALTTTHDLPTVAGWWKGRDIEWRAKLSGKAWLGGGQTERRARKEDRSRLWAALTQSGCVKGKEPAPDEPEPVLDGCLCQISKASSALAIAGIEDLLGEVEQPNLPGSTEEHPNWRRRLPPGDLWSQPKVQARLSRLAARRTR